jgi:hypothetical protein
VTVRPGEATTRLTGAAFHRRSVLGVGAVAGALLLAGLPTAALADQDNGRGGGKGKAKKPKKGGRVDVPGRTAGGARFDGDIRFTKFSVVQGSPNRLVGNASLTGKFLDARGKTVATVEDAPFTTQVKDIPRVPAARANTVTIAQTGAPGTGAPGTGAPTIPIPDGCRILNLVLGPLQLDLLGLVLTIPDTVTIDLTAVPGGGLLGDLLCGIANLLQGGLSELLDSIVALTALATQLNELFALLGTLPL